jgi:cellulose synthase/poly-beta-1,6-N-acetylglucosamine synthase-like glycosyltransferase
VAVQAVTAILAFFTLLPIAAMALAWSYYAWRCRHPWPAPPAPPEVAVILPLRGADPLLESCLAGVLAQDYPAYQVHIVIDSAQDSSQAMVARVLARGHARNAQVHVGILREPSERCSLKLSAQRQVLTALDDAVAVVAFLDADSVPSANWLRAMVAPFADPRIGAATGIRWSAPADAGLGTLVRYVFNALSFPQRFLYRIPWGGSLAVRKSALREAGLLDHWSRCFCEDTSAYGPLRAAGFRLAPARPRWGRASRPWWRRSAPTARRRLRPGARYPRPDRPHRLRHGRIRIAGDRDDRVGDAHRGL